VRVKLQHSKAFADHHGHVAAGFYFEIQADGNPEAVRHLLRKATPPAKPGEHEARIRRAHTALYGEHP
jgi:hypothetical protein